MTDDQKGTFTFNQDGSVDLPVEGKPIRFVRESDLLAVKGGAETKLREWETEKSSLQNQLGDMTRLRDEAHQNFIKAQADKEQELAKFKDYDTLKAKVGEQDKALADNKTSLSKYQEELKMRITDVLKASGASEESLKDKTLDQLRNLEEAARILGKVVQPRRANYDGGGGGGSAPETPFERAKATIAKQEERQGIRAKVSNEGVK